MSIERYLIVNADDFGLSRGVNRGIVAAHERGIVTSASLMVRWPAAVEAAAYGRSRPELSLGLHVDLGEWVYRNPDWVPLYEVVSLDDRAAVADEVTRQVDSFARLVGRNPTHLDSHQHVHRDEPLATILMELAHALGVPLRHRTPGVRYDGRFYGQTGKGAPVPGATSAGALRRILTTLPPGTTELACHPGMGNDVAAAYRRERWSEVEALCDPSVRTTIKAEAIRLRPFGHVGNPWRPSPLDSSGESGPKSGESADRPGGPRLPLF